MIIIVVVVVVVAAAAAATVVAVAVKSIAHKVLLHSKEVLDNQVYKFRLTVCSI